MNHFMPEFCDDVSSATCDRSSSEGWDGMEHILSFHAYEVYTGYRPTLIQVAI